MAKVSNIGEERLVRALTGGQSGKSANADKGAKANGKISDSFSTEKAPSELAASALKAITGQSPTAVFKLAGMAIGQAGADHGVTKEGVDEAAKIWAELGYK